MEAKFEQKPSILSCVTCRREYDLDDRFTCECSGLLEVIHDFSHWRHKAGHLKAMFEIRRWRRADKSPAERRADESGVWRFRDLVMPGIPVEELVTRGEGNTPLFDDFRRTNAWLGLDRVLLKHQGFNPTGSFKDCGMTVGMTWAKKRGAKIVACASTGNTSASVASYAAHAGIPSLILLSENGTALGKIAQSLAYGATTVMIRGDFDAALKLLREMREKYGLTVMNSVNPVRLEGQKAIMFEALEQIGWQAPDWVVVPAGNLGNGSALHKALSEALALGLIDRMPQIAMVQAHGAAPFYLSRKAGWTRETVKANTFATAIKIGDPVNYDKAKRAILDSRGIVIRVTDREIAEAKAAVDSDGIGAEPASCATVAGIRKLVDSDVIVRGQTVMGVLTGHMLKDPDATMQYHAGIMPGATYERSNPPIKIDATSEAFEAVLASLARK